MIENGGHCPDFFGKSDLSVLPPLEGAAFLCYASERNTSAMTHEF